MSIQSIRLRESAIEYRRQKLGALRFLGVSGVGVREDGNRLSDVGDNSITQVYSMAAEQVLEVFLVVLPVTDSRFFLKG